MRPCALSALLLLAAAGPVQANDVPVVAVIEIPAGSSVKYERDAEGRIFVDRFLSAPVVYPVNYGALQGTKAGDGDELDVLVHSRQPIVSGALISVRLIGVLRMTDGGEGDEKIIAVPSERVDPSYAQIRSIEDLPDGERLRISEFFRLYKQAPDGTSPVVMSGFGDAAEAQAMVRTARGRAARP